MIVLPTTGRPISRARRRGVNLLRAVLPQYADRRFRIPRSRPPVYSLRGRGPFFSIPEITE
jgi:hypothetical protein